MNVIENPWNPSMLEMEAGKPGVQGHPQLHSEFKISLDYMCVTLWGKGTEKKRNFMLYSGICEYSRDPLADDTKCGIGLDLSGGSPNRQIPQHF